MDSHALVWPAPRVGDMDSHASLWPLELGGWTLSRFGVAPRVGVVDSHASVWPLELGPMTPTLPFGPSRWGYGLP